MPNMREDSSHPVKREVGRPQLHYVDNLKTVLTALVIFHHTAISYGGDGAHLYRSSLHTPSSSVALIGFNHLNQTFFMASFFYLAGHFSQRSLQRKSRRGFVQDRLYRLGLPAVVYTLVAPSLCSALLAGVPGQSAHRRAFIEDWKHLRGVRGPVWFTATLFVFDMVLASSRKLQKALSPGRPSTNAHDPHKTKGHVRYPGPLLGVAICSLVDAVIRVSFPIGTIFGPLSLNVGYLPQYILAYLFGARVRKIDDCYPTAFDTLGLVGSSLASSLYMAHAFVIDHSTLMKAKGGWNGQAVCYAICNNTTGYLLGSALLATVSRYANFPLTSLTSLSYSAFLVHMPISVALGAWTDGWRASAELKTVVVGSANLIGSWACARLATTAWAMLLDGLRGLCREQRRR